MPYDVVVIGAGPAGYVCAIRAAQLGLKTAVVEKDKTFGGTCVNVGCIPSKALLHASERFEEAAEHFAPLGIVVAKPKLDLKAMMKHKDDSVSANTNGLAFLFKKNKIESFRGAGRIAAPGKVEVKGEGGTTTLDTKSIVIASGSEVTPLKGVDVDEKTIVTSTGGLLLDKVPGKLIVIGAGIIGLELGSVWRRLGAAVEVVEFLDRILPGMDAEVARQAQRLFERQGMKFHLGSKVTGAEKSKKGVTLSVEPAAGGGAATKMDADVVLVAIGRRPFTAGLGLDQVSVAMTKGGRIMTDDHFATSVPGIYAIGDVIDGPMLAHKGEDEGMALAERLAGKAGHVNRDVIPSVVYTFPEIAALGKTEEELKAAGVAYSVGKFPFSANGRARTNRTPEGFVKVIADKDTDRVLGVHMLGAGVGEMIHEAAVLMEFGGSAEDLARTCHAHPTMSEAVKEAALAVDKRPIHL
jgi:dihydrolipoamide dehydrogenase